MWYKSSVFVKKIEFLISKNEERYRFKVKMGIFVFLERKRRGEIREGKKAYLSLFEFKINFS